MLGVKLLHVGCQIKVGAKTELAFYQHCFSNMAISHSCQIAEIKDMIESINIHPEQKRKSTRSFKHWVG